MMDAPDVLEMLAVEVIDLAREDDCMIAYINNGTLVVTQGNRIIGSRPVTPAKAGVHWS